MVTLVILRHGGSRWNLENKFQGWADIDLSEKGFEEAKQAGVALKKNGYSFDVCYTSFLKRAIKTNDIILNELDLMYIPVYKHWRLNERHYGGLTGLNKTEMAEKVGKEQVHIWRRSFDIPPPALEESDKRHPKHDPKYKFLTADQLPSTESFKLTFQRFLPYWEVEIAPTILSGKKVLITTHGTIVRSIVKILDKISDENIQKHEIPTGNPLVYDLDKNLNVKNSFYLEK